MTDVLNQSTGAIYLLIVVLALITLLLLLDNFRNSVHSVRHISKAHHMMNAGTEYANENIIAQIKSEVTPAGKIILIVSYVGLGKLFLYTSMFLLGLLSFIYYILKLDVLFPKGLFAKRRNRDDAFGDADANSL